MISSSSLLIENCVEDVIVANWLILFLSTRWSLNSECEVYIVRHDEDQILCQRSCLTRRITDSRNENIWSKEQISTWRQNVWSRNVRQVTLIFIWTLVDKIRFESRFSDMFVTRYTRIKWDSREACLRHCYTCNRITLSVLWFKHTS